MLNIGPHELELAFKKGVALKEQIEQLRQSKEPDWQEKAMQMIRQSRFEEPILEKQRLKGAGVIKTAEDEEKIIQAFQTSASLDTEKAESMLAQALEMKQIFEETHYVFTHGQTHSGYFLSLVYKAEAKLAGKMTKHFKLVRPHSILEEHESIDKYVKGGYFFDHDLSVRRDLLSCSGNLYCDAIGESANSFMSCNQSMCTLDELLVAQIGQATADQLTSTIPKTTSTGNLYVVCIPKEKWTEVAYRCHPGGMPCTCKTESDATTLLQRAQEGTKTLDCEKFQGAQYRIDLRSLKLDSKIYALTPFTKTERRHMKAIVDQTIHQRRETPGV